MKSKTKVKELTSIGLGIAAIIVGGFMILQVSLVLPVPGVKYILMSPYLSMVIFILLVKIKGDEVLLKIGMTFGLIMMVVNIYMGLSIVITTILTQLTILPLKGLSRAFYGAILFSGYTGLVALTVSKILIGGAFKEIPNMWVIISGLLCLSSGFIGTLFAKKLLKHMTKYSYE